MACKVARAAWAEGGDHPSLGVLTSTRGAICDQSPGALSWSGPKQGTKPLCLPLGFPCEWGGGSFERENCTWGAHVQWGALVTWPRGWLGAVQWWEMDRGPSVVTTQPLQYARCYIRPVALSKQPSIDSLIQFYIMINLVTIKLSIFSPVMSVSGMTFRSWSGHCVPHAALVPRWPVATPLSTDARSGLQPKC